ncbi:MAG: Fe-S-binding domain-containing protein, partial [Candidatus Rokuibacteriota bacterium]
MIPLLTLVTFLPGAAGLALLFVPRRSVGVLRLVSLVVTVLTFACSLPLYFGFDGDAIGYQFEENRRWMPTLGVAYHVGIDGISLLLVLLTTFLILFYVFWEAMLIPMYFIIGIWGGPNRVYAAVKFILYTMVGSLLMLVAILGLYYQYGAATGRYTFDVPVLAQYVMAPGLAQNLMFLAFALAFAIKVPLFPFHTWLPDAHVEAPTAGSVV